MKVPTCNTTSLKTRVIFQACQMQKMFHYAVATVYQPKLLKISLWTFIRKNTDFLKFLVYTSSGSGENAQLFWTRT